MQVFYGTRLYKKWGGKLFKRIYIPYLLLALIFGNPLNVSTLFRILWGSDQTVDSVTSSHLWFLPCFFISSFIYQILFIIIKKPTFRLLIIILMGTISSLLDYNSTITIQLGGALIYLSGHAETSALSIYNLGFPFDLNVAFTGIVFMYMGTVLKKMYDRYELLENKQYLLASITLIFPLGFLFYKLNMGYVTTTWIYAINAISWAVYGNYLYFLLASFLLSVAFLNVAALINNKYFARWGQYTLAIYAFHPFIMYSLNRYMQAMKVDILNVYGPLEIYTLLILIICIVSIPIIRKIDNHLIGE